jgi:hypothetical protein
MPVTTPDIDPTTAIPGEEDDQVPPETISERVLVFPAQIMFVPVIGAGTGLTVTTLFTEQPVASK